MSADPALAIRPAVQHPPQRSKELIAVLQSITSMPGANTSGASHCIKNVNQYKHLIMNSDDFVAVIQLFSPLSTFKEKEISTGMLVIAFHGEELIGSHNKNNGITALA